MDLGAKAQSAGRTNFPSGEINPDSRRLKESCRRRNVVENQNVGFQHLSTVGVNIQIGKKGFGKSRCKPRKMRGKFQKCLDVLAKAGTMPERVAWEPHPRGRSVNWTDATAATGSVGKIEWGLLYVVSVQKITEW